MGKIRKSITISNNNHHLFKCTISQSVKNGISDIQIDDLQKPSINYIELFIFRTYLQFYIDVQYNCKFYVKIKIKKVINTIKNI